jgi:hypothetical protein
LTVGIGGEEELAGGGGGDGEVEVGMGGEFAEALDGFGVDDGRAAGAVEADSESFEGGGEVAPAKAAFAVGHFVDELEDFGFAAAGSEGFGEGAEGGFDGPGVLLAAVEKVDEQGEFLIAGDVDGLHQEVGLIGVIERETAQVGEGVWTLLLKGATQEGEGGFR